MKIDNSTKIVENEVFINAKQRIQQRRVELNLTQAKVALELGMSTQHYSVAERMTSSNFFRFDQIIRLKNILEVPYSFIFEGQMVEKAEDMLEFEKQIKHLTDYSQAISKLNKFLENEVKALESKVKELEKTVEAQAFLLSKGKRAR